jgi:hypothetical protein
MMVGRNDPLKSEVIGYWEVGDREPFVGVSAAAFVKREVTYRFWGLGMQSSDEKQRGSREREAATSTPIVPGET